jgi:hypothetical protein
MLQSRKALAEPHSAAPVGLATTSRGRRLAPTILKIGHQISGLPGPLRRHGTEDAKYPENEIVSVPVR